MRLRPCSAAQHDVIAWARLSVTLNGNPTFGLQGGLPLRPVNPEPAGLVCHTPLPVLSFVPNPYMVWPGPQGWMADGCSAKAGIAMF